VDSAGLSEHIDQGEGCEGAEVKEMTKKDYTFRFESSKAPETIFSTLLDVRKWWSGIYGEEIKGNTKKIYDEFSFSAGDGAHYSHQLLTELVPGKKITWQVTDSKLTFLDKPDEWKGTEICFDVVTKGNKSQVTFTHRGLVPAIECYDTCSDAWSQYLKKLAEKLK
jgi:hypothetical protein